MAIENNLPVIFDTATQNEDGLMSYQDKIKLDSIDEQLNDRLSKTDKISSDMLDTSSDAAKIQPINLSDEVKRMMTGQSQVSATVPNDGVTTEKIAANAVTIDKIDKRTILGNVVSVRPLNFAFDTKKVTINIPQNSILVLDANTKRILATDVDTTDKVININYPTEFDGLNYLVSSPSGSISMINNRKASTISNTDTIFALVFLTKTFQVSIVMNGNYTINGLAQGIGTESAALLGTGKIIFDKSTGIVDFTKAPVLHLITGGVFNRTIQNQSSIRLVDYTEDAIYVLYWDNTTSSLKTASASITIPDTDINKIALIKDGVIIPFVNTGIYYSIPYTNAHYYTETFESINTVEVISKEAIDIARAKECKIYIPEETYVCLNEDEILVVNKECYYEDREGLHFILFDLDNANILCRHSKAEAIDKKTITIGTMWVKNETVIISGSFKYTVDGKTEYQDDLLQAETTIENIQNTLVSDLTENKILVSDELYMITEEELPVYESSMLINSAECIKPAVAFNRNSDAMKPVTEFFNGDILLDNTMGDFVSLLAYDKYNKKSYLKKDVIINKVPSNSKAGQSVKILCLGDDLINDKVAYYVKNKLTSLNVTPEMVGTMNNSNVSGEGRNGWFYSTFVGASGRGLEEGKIVPQTSRAASSILLNPFIRVANADDKANRPNDCYRSTGVYVEKSYYNDTNTSGAFYIFDFAKYLEVQGITTPDVVVIAIKPELVNIFTEDIVSTNMLYMKQLVSGIRAALPDTHIALIPQYGACTADDDMWKITSKMIEETIAYVNKLEDNKIKVLSSWIHMNREFGTEYSKDSTNTQLYSEVVDTLNTKLTDNAKIELANTITAFILNI